MAANLEAAGARQGLAEDQASAVVEGFEGLRIELVQAALLTPWLGAGGFDRSTPGGSLTKYAVQPAA
jgi:hypothetical protein